MREGKCGVGALGCSWALLLLCLARRGRWQPVRAPCAVSQQPRGHSAWGGGRRGGHVAGLRRGPGRVPSSSLSPGARYRGSWDVCQALNPRNPCGMAEPPSPSGCVPRSPGYGPARAAGGCGPKPPALRAASVPPSASAPGQLQANGPRYFPPGKQPLQPGTLVSSWPHPRCEFGPVTALSCSFWGAEVLGPPSSAGAGSA